MALYLQQRGYDAVALQGGYQAALGAGFKAVSASGPIAPPATVTGPATTPVPIVPAVTPVPIAPAITPVPTGTH